MTLFDAHHTLTDLMLMIDIDMPITLEVTTKLNDLGEFVSDGGPDIRDKMLELGAYAIVIRSWYACCSSGVTNVPSPAVGAALCRDAVLKALYSLTAGHPEIIDATGWEIIAQALDKTCSEPTHILVLKLCRNIFIKSEANREHFTWILPLLEPLVSIIFQEKPSVQLLKEWCAAIKALILSDDPRVPYNRAPERKRFIARTKVLPIVAAHLHQPEYENDEGALNAMIIFLGSMAISDDMCIQIENGNVLPAIQSILRNHFHNKTLIRNAVSLLRYLSINDYVREKCSGYALMKWVVALIDYYKKETDMVDVGLNCCAFMTLQNACQTSQFLSKNGLSMVMTIMTDHSEDVTILKGACFTLRNVCENSDKETRDKMIEVGFPALLIQIAMNVEELKEFYVMPVLRQLGITGIDNDGNPTSPSDAPEDAGTMAITATISDDIDGGPEVEGP
ncbi:Armadillo repeat-containing protein 6 [Orchesella cincta]|uniref:Armadillo repeat-containing protein 6 n=1 Tax=Orchesella cincta TaxID=48709 RepID=A0A1D2N256_ORCCI|nr:Armadillo repeat-containing protein 6 [Orchesella cincta]